MIQKLLEWPPLWSKNSNFINHYEMKNFEGDKIMTLCSARMNQKGSERSNKRKVA